MSDSQLKQILAHLKSGRSITPLEALAQYGCFRLGARIYDLKQIGHDIHRTMFEDHKTGKTFARYVLVKEADSAAQSR